MKIAIPTTDGVTIAERTGQARGYMIYFLTNGKIDRQIHKILPNNLNHTHHEGGNNYSQKNLVKFLLEYDLLLVKKLGPHMREDLLKEGLPFLMVEKIFLDEVLDEYLATQSF